jgi:hypothetical protein
MVRSTQFRRLAWARIATALLALALCCLLPAAASAGKRHHRHPPRPVYWGAWIGTQLTGASAPWDMGAVARFEELMGKGVSLLEFSSPFEDCNRIPCRPYDFPRGAMDSVRQHGSIPLFSWGAEVSPRTSEVQPDYQLADLIEGRYDSYIADFASEARNWGHPFFLRFNWEMNGDWFPWSESVNGNAAGQYVAAWRHVHDIFTAVGATNVTWVWCPFADPRHRYQGLRSLYPGSAYVDWTCMDGYNWGRSPINRQPWRSFGELFDPTYKELTERLAPDKPLMLGEFATGPTGGHKALWIRNLFEKLPQKYPRIRALAYFDTIDRGVDWPLESSATAVKAFAAGIRKGIYADNRFGELASSPIVPLR